MPIKKEDILDDFLGYANQKVLTEFLKNPQVPLAKYELYQRLEGRLTRKSTITAIFKLVMEYKVLTPIVVTFYRRPNVPTYAEGFLLNEKVALQLIEIYKLRAELLIIIESIKYSASPDSAKV